MPKDPELVEIDLETDRQTELLANLKRQVTMVRAAISQLAQRRRQRRDQIYEARIIIKHTKQMERSNASRKTRIDNSPREGGMFETLLKNKRETALRLRSSSRGARQNARRHTEEIEANENDGNDGNDECGTHNPPHEVLMLETLLEDKHETAPGPRSSSDGAQQYTPRHLSKNSNVIDTDEEIDANENDGDDDDIDNDPDYQCNTYNTNHRNRRNNDDDDDDGFNGSRGGGGNVYNLRGDVHSLQI